MSNSNDFLDDLKGAWKQQPKEKLYSREKIFSMLHHRSRNSVKWIFIISLVEFVLGFLGALSFYLPQTNQNGDVFRDVFGEYYFVFQCFNLFNLLVVLAFIYLFYKAYRNISVTHSVNGLIRDILNFRRVAHIYIIYNLVVFAAIIVPFILWGIDSELFIKQYAQQPGAEQLTKSMTEQMLQAFYWLKIAFIAVVGLFLMLYYRVVYGILLGKLKRNKNELEAIND